MRIGKFLGKIITAPIKIIAMPVIVIRDVVESGPNDNLLTTVTDSIEKQVEETCEQ